MRIRNTSFPKDQPSFQRGNAAIIGGLAGLRASGDAVTVQYKPSTTYRDEASTGPLDLTEKEIWNLHNPGFYDMATTNMVPAEYAAAAQDMDTGWYEGDGDFDLDPELLNQLNTFAPGVVEQAASSSFDWNGFVSKIAELVGTGVMLEAQRDLLRVNLERAQKGLPPISAQQYMPGVNVGVSDDTKLMLYILGGIGFAALFLPALLKRGR